MGRIGAHVSVAGGLHHAFARAQAIGCEALQIFVKNASRWQAKPLDQAAIEAFGAARAKHPLPLVAHAAYLINVCSDNPATRSQSIRALTDELRRCDQLGVAALVMHPGAHMGQGAATAHRLIAQALEAVFDELPELSCKVLLENTAGQGTTLGATFDELARIIDILNAPVGVCVDSCHAFAAGYPLAAADGYQKLLADLDKTVGLARVDCWHLNDSVFAAGARKDRHASIGQGQIGLDFFAQLLADSTFELTPMIVETPLGDDGLGHARDLATLRALRGCASATTLESGR